MERRPKCAVKGCNREALMLVSNKLICGECYNNYMNKINKNKFKEIEEANEDFELTGKAYCNTDAECEACQ